MIAQTNIPTTSWVIYAPTVSVGSAGGKILTYDTLVGTFDVIEQLDDGGFTEDNQQEGLAFRWVGYIAGDAGYSPSLRHRVTLGDGSYGRVESFELITPNGGNIDPYYVVRVSSWKETS